MTKKCLTPFILFSLLWMLSGSVSKAANSYEGSYYNETLRQYFRGLLTRSSGPWMGMGTGISEFMGDRTMLELRIDRLIEDLLKHVRAHLMNIDRELGRAEEARRLWLGDSTPVQRRVVLRRWVHALEKIEDEAGDLRSQLSLPLSRMKRRSDFNPVVDRKSRERAFEVEMRYLSEQIEKAERKITDYLLTSKHIVGVNELQEESFLTNLHRTQKMASAVAKQLKKMQQ